MNIKEISIYLNRLFVYKKENYDFELTKPQLKGSLDKLAKELREKVLRHVGVFLLLDERKCGVFLSGGVDSSIIVASMKKFRKDIYTICAKFEDDDFDESDKAKIIAKKFKTKHYEFKVTKEDYMKVWNLLIRKTKEPLAFQNAPVRYLMAKKLKSLGVKILFTGEYGDELFCGYDKNCSISDSYKGKETQLDHFLKNYQYLFSDKDKYFLFSKKVKREIGDGYYHKKKVIGEFFNRYDVPYSEKIQYIMYKLHGEGVMRQMSHLIAGLRWIAPLGTPEIIRFAFNLPKEYKMKKKILIRAFPELPKKITKQEKYGFSMPFDKWFRDDKKIKKFLLKNDRKIFDMGNLKYFLEHPNSFERWGDKVWLLVNLEKWYRNIYK